MLKALDRLEPLSKDGEWREKVRTLIDGFAARLIVSGELSPRFLP